MSEQFLGEIRLFANNFAPRGWALCDGQLLPINQNQALFALFGTMYGGNGQTTFALPDLRGRVPIHVGDGYMQGQASGREVHTLGPTELPAHMHIAQASVSDSNTPSPNGSLLARAAVYTGAASLSTLHPSSVTTVGGSQPHNNMQPYLVLNFCVAMQGIFPSRS